MSRRAHTPPEALIRRLHWIRIFQITVLVINLITSAYLAGYVGSRGDLRVRGGLIVPVILAGSAFVMTGLSHWFGHRFDGYEKRRCVWFVLKFDLGAILTQIGAIAILAVAKLPFRCTGLARSRDDVEDLSGTTEWPGFGDAEHDGALDRFCNIPKAYFWLAIILLLSYLHTIGLCIQLIVALTRRAKSLKAERQGGHGLEENLPSAMTQAPSSIPIQSTGSRSPYPAGSTASPLSPERDAGPVLDESVHSWALGTMSTPQSPPPYNEGQGGKKDNLGQDMKGHH